jgi:hypothetical protein
VSGAAAAVSAAAGAAVAAGTDADMLKRNRKKQMLCAPKLKTVQN